MALVTCPKCGGQISDTAGECVHCGFTFKICPECGTVLAKDAEKCEHCGYAFREAGTDEAIIQPAPAVQKIFLEEWENSEHCPALLKPKAAKIMRILGMIGMMVSAALCGLTVGWDTKSDLEKIFHFREILTWFQVASISAIVFVGIEDFDTGNIRDFFHVLLCSKWLKSQSFDPIANIVLCESSNASVQKEKLLTRLERKNRVRKAKICTYINHYPEQKKKYLWVSVLETGLNYVAIILAAIWYIEELSVMICMHIELGTDWAFGALNYGWLIAAAVFFVIGIIISLLLHFFEKKCDAWIDGEIKKIEK